jgi:hypothetical protein
MISLETLQRLLTERKCPCTLLPLSPDEYVVSRKSFPKLYGGGRGDSESKFISAIFDHIPSVLSSQSESDVRDCIRGFMQLVLRNGTMHSEDFLHRYIFEFWGEIEHPFTSKSITESYFKCQDRDSTNSDFFRHLVRKIYQSGKTVPDIIACTRSSEIFVIEIKNAELDDRALGQILRYYQIVRSTCDRSFFDKSAWKITPILIATAGRLDFWDSLPMHFREFLEIFFWQTTSDGRINLIDGKASLRESAKSRLRELY